MTTATGLINPYAVEGRRTFIQLMQDKKVITTTLIVSILIHVAMFVRFSGLQTSFDMTKDISHSVEIVLTKYVPEKPPEIEKKQTPPKPPVKKIEPKPEPVKTLATPVKQPLVEKTVLEDPIEEEILEEEPVEDSEPMLETQPNNVPVDPAFLISEKERYLKVLAAHLDKHKFYPRAARRRHIEGEVKVSFDLLLDGRVLNLHTFSGHPMLQKATSDSIHKAMPMPPRPESLLALNTMKIEYAMQYALK